jgi:hypothetical protein
VRQRADRELDQEPLMPEDLGGQPRSRPIRFIICANGGNASSAASCDVCATKPWELMLSAGGACPASIAARRFSSANGAKR